MGIRSKGLLQLLASGLVFALLVWWFAQQRGANASGSLPGGGLGLTATLVPGGFALAGLMQLVTGIQFSELSDRWNALAGWQRGVIGTSVFAFGLLLLFGGLVGYGYLTNGGG